MCAVKTIAAFAIMIAATANAQTPQFEVASIKPAPPPDGSYNVRMSGGPGQPDPGLFTCENFGLANLITIAYSLDSDRFSGPAWISDAKFNISAKVPEGATWEQFTQMLQNLLAERFKLKFHYVKNEVTRQVLVVAKSGAKLKQSVASLPDDPPRQQTMSMNSEDGQSVMRAVDSPMSQLAAQLSGSLHQQVADETGLPGNYDFTLRWAEGTSAEEGGSPILGALEKQLGLKLEKKKVLVDVMVIDHIEKTPTEN
jgi:uncharacterized protein (TIGR03435 family)